MEAGRILPEMPALMLVPDGATKEQVEAMRCAQANTEAQDIVEWLTKYALPEGVFEDYRARFDEIMDGYGVESAFYPSVFDGMSRFFQREVDQVG